MRIVPAVATLLLVSAPATAQTLRGGVEATNDEVRRGLSWSQGRASISADAAATIGPVDASVRVAALRGSARHADADGVADLTLGTGWDLGTVRLRATGIGHLFFNADSKMDYAELGGSASYSLGPARVTAGALYAPSQDAIGGSNLYLYAGADAGIPGTPLTAVAQLGRSSGEVDDPVRAQRLRPGGRYVDWRLGVEHRSGPVTLGLDYLGTDVARRDAFGPFANGAHVGDRLVGRARFDF
ncbi:TorF family putative porin [Sphingomonas rubra]|uniref:Porin n=1 Tax=Sphingomonas rubra TaxID=634430 RepID=A0A1I5PY46_9SPHN|nr:TorF family putative porin [Sphingomonas rubra]SFP38690.1 protein of unknown function (Gcw_chp) [Sphingomonas rubra]